MTEAEWEASGDIEGMMALLRARGGMNWRASRLSACAIARWQIEKACSFASRPDAVAAVEATEAHALDPWKSLQHPEHLRHLSFRAERLAEEVFRAMPVNDSLGGPALEEGDPAVRAMDALGSAARAAGTLPGSLIVFASEAPAACAVLRDVAGWPLRRPSPFAGVPVAAQKAVRMLAWAAVWERREGVLDGARLLVLSDALEEAGCGDAAALAHLRRPGPHYAGCWAVFAVLGLGDRS
jgi:hypothetical protein